MREGLLIDAYNLFHAARASSHARLFPDIKRLAYLVEHYASEQGSRVVMVIDGTRFSDEFTDTRVTRFIFSEGGRPADTVMEAWMAALPPAERLNWVLVSNDLNLKRMGSGTGLRVRGCADMVLDLAAFARTGSAGSGSGASARRTASGGDPFNNPFKRLTLALAFMMTLLCPFDAAAAEFSGFVQPESTAADASTGDLYVSNRPPLPPQEDPADKPVPTPGFISKITAGGLVVIQKFIQGGPEGSGHELRSPRGMAVSEGRLYVADGSVVRVYRTDTGAADGVIRFETETAVSLAHLAAGSKGEIFAADGASDRIFRIDTRRRRTVALYSSVGAVRRPVSLAYDRGTHRIFVAGADSGLILRIDRPGRARILRKHVKDLAGIFIDGTGALFFGNSRKGELYRVADRGEGALSLAAGAFGGFSTVGYDPATNAALILFKSDGRLLTVPLSVAKTSWIPKNLRRAPAR